MTATASRRLVAEPTEYASRLGDSSLSDSSWLCQLGPPYQPARSGIGELAIGEDLLTIHQGGHIAFRPLYESAGPAGKVTDLFGLKQAEAFVIDDVEIGLAAWLDDSSVPESVELGRIMGETSDRCLQVKALASSPISRPVADEVRGHTGVADQSDVCPAIAKTLDRHRITHHLGKPIVRVIPEVQQWQQQEPSSF